MESLKKAAAAPAVLHPSKKIYYHLVSASSPLELSVWDSIYSADEDLKNHAFITQLNFSSVLPTGLKLFLIHSYLNTIEWAFQAHKWKRYGWSMAGV